MMTQEAIIIEEMIAIKATLILRDKLLLTTGVTLNIQLDNKQAPVGNLRGYLFNYDHIAKRERIRYPKGL